jgi:type II secretory pathway component GspD/PulD (secretin)
MRATIHTLRITALLAGVLISTPALGTRPAPAAEPEKKVRFVFDNAPWRDVFQWLTDVTGKPVISAYTPEGTFSFHGPKDKLYTIDEVVDIINCRLDDCQRRETYYELIHRERSFTLAPANEKVDPVRAPQRVRPSERKKADLSKVVITLTRLDADDIVPQVRKMMGPFGEVKSMKHTGANQLLLIDTAENIRAIREMIEESDKATDTSPAPPKEPGDPRSPTGAR